MENTEKLADLLKQLEESGYVVKETDDESIENLKNSSNLSRETLDQLSSNKKANFNAWVAWSKSF